MKYILALLLVFALSGCATLSKQTDTSELLATETAYEAVLKIAVAYNKRPRCGPPGLVVCSDPLLIARVRQANDTAVAALHVWHDAVFAQTPDQAQKQAAAQVAVNDFKSTVAEAK